MFTRTDNTKQESAVFAAMWPANWSLLYNPGTWGALHLRFLHINDTFLSRCVCGTGLVSSTFFEVHINLIRATRASSALPSLLPACFLFPHKESLVSCCGRCQSCYFNQRRLREGDFVVTEQQHRSAGCSILREVWLGWLCCAGSTPDLQQCPPRFMASFHEDLKPLCTLVPEEELQSKGSLNGCFSDCWREPVVNGDRIKYCLWRFMFKIWTDLTQHYFLLNRLSWSTCNAIVCPNSQRRAISCVIRSHWSVELHHGDWSLRWAHNVLDINNI